MKNQVTSSDRRKRRPPLVLLILAALGLAVFVIPLLGLLARTPWRDLPTLLTGDVVLDALRVSVIASLGATAISAILGVPLAWVLARVEFPGRSIVRGLVVLPLVLPFSTWGVVIAATFVAMPFLVITVEGALRNLDARFEGAAATLGAGRWTVLRRVTLPMIGPSLAAGLALTWARALGEFGATITFAGNLQGRTQTLPLAVFVALESDRGAAVALSLVMVVISLTVLVVLRERWWRAL
jgi:molybdate transport system permease protein